MSSTKNPPAFVARFATGEREITIAAVTPERVLYHAVYRDGDQRVVKNHLCMSRAGFERRFDTEAARQALAKAGATP